MSTTTTASVYSLSWDEAACAVRTLDQRYLPQEARSLTIGTVEELIEAISTLAIRGAPTLGLAGAFGVALAAGAGGTTGEPVDPAEVRRAAAAIVATRPTAVNLARGVNQALAVAPHGADAVLAHACAMLADDETTNRRAARRAARLVRQRCPDRPLRIATHCNTGRLATAAHGTALGAITDLAAEGRVAEIVVGETRPLLQGARLTTWELAEHDIPHVLAVDSALAWAIAGGEVDCVLVGADRVARNGDVANKIGTYALALAAHRHRIPFIVVAPEASWDERLLTGADIAIEQRDPDEVRNFAGHAVAPAGTRGYNPAFDVTPISVITAVVSEDRVHTAPGASELARHVRLHPDFPRPGVVFADLAPVYDAPAVFAACVTHLAAAVPAAVDRVVAVEARGFLLGSALAHEIGVPLTLARKPGKLPGATLAIDYVLEYGADTLEVQPDAFGADDAVLLVDDVLATGHTLAAAAELVARAGARVAACAVLLTIAGLDGASALPDVPLLSAGTTPPGDTTDTVHAIREVTS